MCFTYVRQKYVPAIISTSKEKVKVPTQAQNRMRSTSIEANEILF